MAGSTYADFQTVSIDFDVFKALTALLQSPSDTYNSVLRRLLDLPVASPTPSEREFGDSQSWVVGGAAFPAGTEFRAKYKGQTHTARVENGALLYNGERFKSPSPAAMAITRNSVNGWIFWECRLPGSRAWVRIDSLRRK